MDILKDPEVRRCPKCGKNDKTREYGYRNQFKCYNCFKVWVVDIEEEIEKKKHREEED